MSVTALCHAKASPRAMVRRGHGRLLGHVGARISPDFKEAELHVLLDSSKWDRRCATEGSAAVLDNAFQKHGLDHILGVAALENGAATCVVEKLRFQPLG